MRLNISAWSIRRPMPASVAFVVLVIFGIFSFRALPITKFPNIDIPIVQVTVTQSGAAPAELESQVTKKVEDAVAARERALAHHLDGDRRLVRHDDPILCRHTNVDRALNDVKDQIAKIRTDLPRTIDEPIVSRLDIEGLPIVTYAASAPGMSVEELSWFVDDTVARNAARHKRRRQRHALGRRRPRNPCFARSEEASRARRDGGECQRAAARHQCRPRRRPRRDRPARSRRSARSRARAASPTLRRSRLACRADARCGSTISATVTDGACRGANLHAARWRSRSSPSRSRAPRARATRRSTSSSPRRSREIQQAASRKSSSPRSTPRSTTRSAIIIRRWRRLIEGAVLAVIVVFLFLRDWRATIVSAIALPLSAIPTFWAMNMLGFSLNLVSLLAITLVTGILVDDAIVEIENIVRHMRMGKSRLSGGARGRRRDRPRGDRDLHDDRRGVRAGELHGRHRRPVFPAVRPDGRGRGVVLAAGGAPDHADGGGLFPASAHDAEPRATARHARLHAAGARWSVRHRWITLVGRPRSVRRARLRRRKLLPSGFIPPTESRARCSRSSCRRARGSTTPTQVTRRHRRPAQEHARGASRCSSIGGQLLGGAVGGAPGDARHRSRAQERARRSPRRRCRSASRSDLATVPDIRFWFLKDNGQRDISLIVAGAELKTDQRARPISSRARCAACPIIDNPMSTAELDRPEVQHHAEAAARRRSRRLDRGAFGDDPRRDASATSTPISRNSTPATG